MNSDIYETMIDEVGEVLSFYSKTQGMSFIYFNKTERIFRMYTKRASKFTEATPNNQLLNDNVE